MGERPYIILATTSDASNKAGFFAISAAVLRELGGKATFPMERLCANGKLLDHPDLLGSLKSST
jgi:hypothetical protein